jgi:hypothetical protein
MSLKALESAKPYLLGIPGVVGFGLSTYSRGELAVKGSEPVVVVYLEREDPQVMRHIPSEIEGFKVKTVVSGRFRTLQLATLQYQHRAKTRPVPGGVSCASLDVGAGTLACRVYDRATGMVLGLANNHVCFDEETEILTENGWIPFSKLTLHDRVATVDTATGELVYQFPTDIQRLWYEGDMIHFHRQSYIDLLVTPDHRLWVNLAWKGGGNDWKRYRRIYKPKWRFMSAQDAYRYIMSGKKLRFTSIVKWNCTSLPSIVLPRVEYVKGRDFNRTEEIPIEEWLTFLGRYIADGSYTIREKWKQYITSIRFGLTSKDYEEADEMLETVKRMGYNGFVLKSGRGLQLRITNKQLCLYLSQLGRAGDKYIPQEFKNLPPKQLEKLFMSYMMGDGCLNDKSWSAVTKSKRLADDLQEIGLKLGYGSMVKPIIGGGSKTGKLYHVSFRRRAKDALIDKRHVKVVRYRGWVYDCTVPNGTLIVRRNGIPIISGNCAQNWGLKRAAYVGKPIIQPSTLDGGRYPDDRIGVLERWVDVNIGVENLVDAAVFRPVDGLADEVLGLVDKPLPAVDASVGDTVRKSGRTTGVTEGVVESVNATVSVEGWGEAIFTDQIITSTAIADQGDSGSYCLNVSRSGTAGLVFAGSELKTAVCKASNVERLLGVSFTEVTPTQAPSWLFWGLVGLGLYLALREYRVI